jgi:hypothetical protein
VRKNVMFVVDAPEDEDVKRSANSPRTFPTSSPSDTSRGFAVAFGALRLVPVLGVPLDRV